MRREWTYVEDDGRVLGPNDPRQLGMHLRQIYGRDPLPLPEGVVPAPSAASGGVAPDGVPHPTHGAGGPGEGEPAGPADAEGEDAVEPDPRAARIKMLLRGMYERHNPAKLPGLEDVLLKYAGREEDVYVRVCQKCGETPDQNLLQRGRQMVATQSKAPGALRSPPRSQSPLARDLRHLTALGQWLVSAVPREQ